MPVTIPPDAEFILIPSKWLPVLQSVARGPFLPINFPLPIIVNNQVPADEIWWGRAIKVNDCDSYEILKKEMIDESETFSQLNISSHVDKLLTEGEDGDRAADRSDADTSTVMGQRHQKSP